MLRSLLQTSRRFRREPTLGVVTVLLVVTGWASTAIALTAASRLLAPVLPVHEPDRLIAIYRGRDPVMPLGAGPAANLSVADVTALSQSGLVDSVAAATVFSVPVRRGDRSFRVSAEAVSEHYFATMQIRGLEGRGLGIGQQVSADVVISARLVGDLYSDRTTVVGSTLQLDDRPHTVVGIMPAEFGGLRAPSSRSIDLWIGLDTAASADLLGTRQARLHDPTYGFLSTVARLPSVGGADMGVRLQALASALEATQPSTHRPREFLPRPFVDVAVSAAADPFIRPVVAGVLVGILGVVTLLVATVGLSFAHHTARLDDEIALRRALGASQAAVLAVPFWRTASIFVAAAPFALLIYAIAMRGLAASFGPALLAWLDLGAESAFFAIGAVPFALVAILGTVAPAIRAGRHVGRARLAIPATRRHRVQMLWLGGSVAMSLVLGAMSMALAGQHRELPSLAAGFDWHTLQVARVTFREPRVDDSASRWSVTEGAVATVQSGAAGWIEDLGPGMTSDVVAMFPIAPPPAAVREGQPARLRLIGISCGLQQVLPLTPVRGRLFTASDCDGLGRGLLLPASTARRLWGATDPIGRALSIDGSEWAVVGTVVDWVSNAERWWSDALPVLVPIASQRPSSGYLVVRSHSSAEVGAAMATALSSHSPVEMSRSVTPAARLATEPFRLFDVVRRLFYWLAAGSFGLALIGACAIAFSNVASRRLEIAVRAALGAGPVAIARCLVGDQIVMAFVTLGVTAVSFVWLRTLMARFMGALLLGWRPGEGTPGMWLAGGVAALLAFGILLSLFVAHRASRLDPAQLLREPM